MQLTQEINQVFDQLIKIVEKRRSAVLAQLVAKETDKQKTLG